MYTLYIRLKEKSSNVLLQSILGTYSHLMWVRMEIPEKLIVRVVSTPELIEETKKVLESLKEEIEFEFVNHPED